MFARVITEVENCTRLYKPCIVQNGGHIEHMQWAVPWDVGKSEWHMEQNFIDNSNVFTRRPIASRDSAPCAEEGMTYISFHHVHKHLQHKAPI